MSESPFRAGEFAWCAFPEGENPVRPGPRHVGYIALSTSSDSGPNAMVAYTDQPALGRSESKRSGVPTLRSGVTV